MKKIVTFLGAAFLFSFIFISCDRIDLEGIGELNRVELWYSPYTSDAAPLPENSDLLDRIETDLGIELKAVALPSKGSEQTEMILQAAETNSLPDIFMVGRDTLTTLLKENKVARVDSMFDRMPERSKVMYDVAARESASFDGLCYGLAQSGSIDRNEGILIRKDWLDNLGLSVPVTTDEFLKVMRAFTFDDPDGNGVDDTYGFGAYLDPHLTDEGIGRRFSLFFGAFGVEGTYNATLKNCGLNIFKPEYYEALEYVRKIIEERLIDPQWMFYNKNSFRDSWKNGRIGLMREQNAAFALEANYRPFDEKFPEGEWLLIAPPKGPRGESSVGVYTRGYRTYAVSRRAQELGKLPVIAKLLEWMSTDGYNYVAYGEEAVNFNLDDEGNITTEGLENPDLAYTKKAAAPLLQLRNLVFYNSNAELAARYPTWYSINGKKMSALDTLREMQKYPWTVAISLPGISKELKNMYEQGIFDFVTGEKTLSPDHWAGWLEEFGKAGGYDWENRCKIYADENNLLMDTNKVE